jgi:hypothetical protein
MEVVEGKCDRCFENVLPEELKINNAPPLSQWTNHDTGVCTISINDEYRKWVEKREPYYKSLPEVLCIHTDDGEYPELTICLDCLGLQRKDYK